ncbi:MAG: DUF4389 domain-containing protein [Catenulispora sp.]|nr:DUF4389 domain-containing protein [Catenulispora sp.]
MGARGDGSSSAADSKGGSQPVAEGFVTAVYPAEGLNRVLPLVKWLIALPHLVIGTILFISAVPVVFLAGAAVFFTGEYPEGLFRYTTGVQRYINRGVSYAMTLTTDKYPPLFKLSE